MLSKPSVPVPSSERDLRVPTSGQLCLRRHVSGVVRILVQYCYWLGLRGRSLGTLDPGYDWLPSRQMVALLLEIRSAGSHGGKNLNN